jgi:hypothetical protein
MEGKCEHDWHKLFTRDDGREVKMCGKCNDILYFNILLDKWETERESLERTNRDAKKELESFVRRIKEAKPE